MDKLEIKSAFMRNLITKAISKMIQKKLGYKINIQLNDLDVKVIEGEAHLHVDAEVKIDNGEFMKIIKTIGLD